jgi:putative ABC transport system permease protein
MRLTKKLRLRLRSLLRGSQVEQELDEELRYHLEHLVDGHIAAGMSPKDARYAALREMGPIEQRKEECRDARGLALIDSLRQDVSYALRSLRKSPGFSAVTIATLALGIGANTAIFSMVDGILLRPLSYRDPNRLVVVRGIIGQFAHLYPTLPSNAAQFIQWRQRSAAFDELSALRPVTFTIVRGDEPRLIEGARVSPNLLRTLGVELHAGRFLLEEENTPGRDDVVVLGYEFWLQRFNARRDVIGTPITLSDRRYTIVGVLPPSFRFPRNDQVGALIDLPARIDVLKPLALTDREATSFGEYDYVVIGRLRQGVSLDQALADVSRIQKQIAATVPVKIDLRVALFPMQDLVVGPVRHGLLLALAAVGVVLLIGCVNLAAVALARASGRLRECAVRVALGATRLRLMRQLLIETLLLGAIGGALGLALAQLMLDFLVTSAPIDLPRLDEVQLDARVASFAILVTATTVALFGLWPAWRLSQSNPQRALQASSRSATEGRGPARLRSMLIAFEVALTMALLVVAGLLVNSLIRLVHVDAGFDVEDVMATGITLSVTRYPNPGARDRFYEQLLVELGRVSGIADAGIGSRPPLSGESSVNTLSRDDDVRPILERPSANYRFVSEAYFRAMGMPLMAGRTFEEHDRGRNVAIVSERTAARLWPGESALGKRFKQDDSSPVIEVIGVVGNSREVGLLNDPPLMAYQPYWTRSPLVASLIVRTTAPFAHVAPQIRATIARLDPKLPVAPVQPMQDLVTAALAPRRFQTLLVAAFAAAALLLSSIGIYGALSYAVARRAGELAIRAALGAQPGILVRQVISAGMKPVGAGLAAGILGAIAMGKGLSSLLFGVQPRDPATIVSVSALLALVALAACCIPAARATRVDPTHALRSE